MTKRKGITLIELLVAASLSTILLLALYAVYSTSYQAYRASINKAELNQNARIALERISRDFRQTGTIVTTLPPNDIDPLNPPSHEIEFLDGHNTDKIQYIKYYLQGNDLHRQVLHYYLSSDTSAWVAADVRDSFGNHEISVDEDVVKANQVTGLKFFGTNPTTTQITVSNSQGNYTYQTEVWGRNL